MTWVTGLTHGNNLVRVAWGSKLHRQTQSRMPMSMKGMVRPDVGDEPTFERREGAPIVSQENLNGKRAQEVRLGLSLQLTRNRTAATGARSINQYTHSTGDMIDNEEQPALSNVKGYVEQMKHAVSFDVPEVQDLRSEFKMTVKSADLLADWCAAEQEESRYDAIYDQYSAHVVAGLSVSTADPPVLNQQWANRKAADGDLNGSDRLTAAELRRMATWASVNNINPTNPMGDSCFLLFCHSFNYADLWTDTTFTNAYENGWQRAADKNANPMFSFADAYYAGIYIYKNDRVRASSASGNVRRCILLGADAIGEGITSRPKLVRRKEDKYEDKFGLAIKAINGWFRLDFAPQSGTTLWQGGAIWALYTETTA
jgi:hypothetical protein